MKKVIVLTLMLYTIQAHAMIGTIIVGTMIGGALGQMIGHSVNKSIDERKQSDKKQCTYKYNARGDFVGKQCVGIE